MRGGLGTIIEDQAERIKKLEELIDKATGFEFGDKPERAVRAERREGAWILLDHHDGVLNGRDRFSYKDF